MTNIVIVAGGLCTRFNELKVFPKILLPTLTNSSILSEDLNEFKNQKVYLVINEIFYDKVLNYITVNSLSDKVTLIKSTNTNGSFNTLKEIKDSLPNKNLLFIWSDLILKDTSFIINICESENSNIVFTNNGHYRYNVSTLPSGISVEEVTTYNGNVPGIYFLKDKSIFERINPKGENIDLIDAIKFDLNNSNYKAINFSNIIEYRDLPTYLKYMSTKISFNPFQTRFFNKLSINPEKTIITKEAVDKAYYHLIEKEIKWYNLYFENTKENFIAPKLYHFTDTSMELEYLKGFEQLHKVLDDFESTNQFEKIKELYKNIQTAVENLGNTLTKEVPFEQFKLDLYTEVVDKVLARCNKIKPLLLNYKEDYLKNILEKAYEYIQLETEKSSDYNKENNTVKYYFCHGDLNGSNILINPNTLEVRFVDPRGYFGKTVMYGWKEYEYSKLLYCLFGYDNFNLLPCVYQKIGLPEVRKSYLNSVSKPKYLDKKLYKVLVGVIYVALAGYISQDIMKANEAYDFGLNLLENELNQI